MARENTESKTSPVTRLLVRMPTPIYRKLNKLATKGNTTMTAIAVSAIQDRVEGKNA